MRPLVRSPRHSVTRARATKRVKCCRRARNAQLHDKRRDRTLCEERPLRPVSHLSLNLGDKRAGIVLPGNGTRLAVRGANDRGLAPTSVERRTRMARILGGTRK